MHTSESATVRRPMKRINRKALAFSWKSGGGDFINKDISPATDKALSQALSRRLQRLFTNAERVGEQHVISAAEARACRAVALGVNRSAEAYTDFMYVHFGSWSPFYKGSRFSVRIAGEQLRFRDKLMEIEDPTTTNRYYDVYGDNTRLVKLLVAIRTEINKLKASGRLTVQRW